MGSTHPGRQPIRLRIASSQGVISNGV